MASDKDTIYIDIDDEITGIIDKLKGSEGKVVALVLPKRAAVFQSIVNMKLLKRAADSEKKNVVLITSETGLMPLAGAAGLFVAKTLTSKPEIPTAPNSEESEESVDEAEAVALPPALPAGEINNSRSVGELSGESTPPIAPALPIKDSGMETIALDNTADEAKDVEEGKGDLPAERKTTPKKNKKLKVPNFLRFRLLLGLFILLLILLIAGFLFLNSKLAKATVDIKTNASNINVNQNLDLSTAAQTLATDGSSVPAKYETLTKTYTQTVPTTGQKNEGNKASGSINVTIVESNNSNNQPNDIPAGTGVSANNLTFITEDDITFSTSNCNKGQCTWQGTDFTNPNNNNAIPIVAQSGGSSYNMPGGTTFTIAGVSSANATGSASGGTDNIVQTVNQNDINNARSKISTNDGSAEQALYSQTKQDGYYPIQATVSVGTPNITPSAAVGDAASSVTVTESITYSVFGVHQSDLDSIITTDVSSQIDTSKQSILNDGLSSATFNVNNITSTTAQLTLSTKAEVGPQLNVADLKKSIAGQKAGAIQGSISSDPGVTSVTVHFSPFWVSSAPKNLNKITVNIAKPGQ